MGRAIDDGTPDVDHLHSVDPHPSSNSVHFLLRPRTGFYEPAFAYHHRTVSRSTTCVIRLRFVAPQEDSPVYFGNRLVFSRPPNNSRAGSARNCLRTPKLWSLLRHSTLGTSTVTRSPSASARTSD